MTATPVQMPRPRGWNPALAAAAVSAAAERQAARLLPPDAAGMLTALSVEVPAGYFTVRRILLVLDCRRDTLTGALTCLSSVPEITARLAAPQTRIQQSLLN